MPSEPRTLDESELTTRRSWSPGDPLGWGGTITERYVVLERVGQGGMGVVLRAYDPKLRREVALKHVKLDRSSPRSDSRLLREAQAMAQLSHPNVVGIYDIVEIPSGGLVLAMEFVEGRTLRQWVEGHRREWLEILAMFRQAGQGLAAAHDVGLIHRDFKPANVLVGPDDRPRVTDFGLARIELEPGSEASLDGFEHSLEREAPEDSELTAPGQLLGTLPYMAPEQQRERTADARSDQYALCVSIWEALCGRRPFRGPSKSQYLRAKEAGPPPWPKGSPVPRVVVDAVRRGLAPDPDDRWPHVQALLRALDYDPSRRRRRFAVGAGMLGVAVASVVGVQLWQAQRATQCRSAQSRLDGAWGAAQRAALEQGLLGTGVAHAPRTAALVTARMDEYAQTWVTMHTEACEATTVRGEQSGEALDLRMECLEDVRTSMAAAATVLAEADAEVANRAMRVVDDLPPLSRCADMVALRAELPPPEDADTKAQVEHARRDLAQARSLMVGGRLGPSHEQLQHLLAEAETLGYPPLTVEVRLQLSDTLRRRGRLEEAETLLSRTLWDAIELGHASVARHAAQRLLYLVGAERRRTEEARVLEPLALALAQGPNGSPLELARVLNTIGNVHRIAGEVEPAEAAFERALEIYEDALGPRSLMVAAVRQNLGALYGSLDRFADAEQQLRLALSARRTALGPEHPQTAETLYNLAWALQLQQQPAQAETLLREALQIHEAVFGPDHWRTSEVIDALAYAVLEQGDLLQAETLARRAVAMVAKAEDAPPTMIASHRSRLGVILERRGRSEEAEAEHRAALEAALSKLPEDHPMVGELDEALGVILVQRGAYAQAEPHLRRALATYETRLPDDSPALRPTLLGLARLTRATARADEAISLYERVVELDAASDDDPPPTDRSELWFELAQLQWGRPTERGSALERARGALELASPPLDAEIEQWLQARAPAPTGPARPSRP
ncbi:MAG: serine/threonine-protein kinase [Nannocystaceae bacterium]